ncbi:DUF1292 domain-containing protein [Oceanobacillus piezotolerans]|uniref:DUF1292 domain-containing protein n=1 Tax=Oceanobacillus piezotolerans TaxID=2448030 RepID=A0A498D1G3_9BACI|nr:DUF1292 domain-containing protein [Oceanobacillus piezotolerans]RLL40593.1 DUF1292 domain-containing protein [Oceanobacillus piezotolerans]
MPINVRDTITIVDENGIEKEYFIEALFEADGKDYALIRKDDESLLMKIEEENDEQYLVGVDNASVSQSLLDAYQIAVEANPAD